MKNLKIKHMLFCMSLLYMQSGDIAACQITPTFSYSSTHTCGLPTIVSAINTSSGNKSSIAKYWWKVNGIKYTDTIIGKDTMVIFLKQTGSNSVRLLVKDSAGCIDSVNVNINVSSNAKTILDQNYTYSHSPSWMNCLQFISDPDSFRINFESVDTLKSLRIFWGDGSSDTGLGNVNPNTVQSHVYNSLGIFHLKIVTTNGSCIDTVYGTVYNQRQPTAGIIGPTSGSNRGCAPHTLRIINNSYNISNNTNFLIEWGNGETITEPYTSYKDTFFHTYKKGVCAGIIKITATNVCGSSFSTWNPIDISEKDKAKWDVSTTCNSAFNHVFLNQSVDRYCLTPDIKEYFWDFGDGTTIGWINSKASQTHRYKIEGNYNVMLIAKTACGNDTFIDQVKVQYNPIAEFKYSADRSCKPLAVVMTDTTAVGRGYTRLWTIREGSIVKTSADSIISHTFTTPGTHSITLAVSNACGSSSKTKTFIVNDKPKAQFGNISSACIPVTVNFSNSSTSYFSNAVYSWNFGDSSTSNLKSPPAKIYDKPGTYTVKLIVSDTCGNDTFSRTFTAYGLPVAVFKTDSSACTFDSIAFANNSLNSSSFFWNFGDNSAATTGNTDTIKHLYTTSGTYNVRLIAASVAGCRDTAFGNIIIKPGAKALFDLNNSYACTPARFKFTNNSVYGKNYYWYANGNLISTASTPADTVLYTDSSIIRLKLICTSASSCQDDSVEKVFFTPKNPVADVDYPDSGCGALKVNYNNNSQYSGSYNWNLGNGLSSTARNPVSLYPYSMYRDTVYKPVLIANNWAGCKDTANLSIKIFPPPHAEFATDKDKGCGPLQILFTNHSKSRNNYKDSTLKYLWYFGDQETANCRDTSFTFNPSLISDSIIRVTLLVTSVNACRSSDTAFIKVYPLPFTDFVPDKTDGCALLPVNFNNISDPRDTGSINIMRFEWNSGNGKTGTTKNFNALYSASLYGDTVYNIRLKAYTEHGCADSANADITVHPQPLALFSTDTVNGCSPLKIKTINNSVSKDGLALRHDWVFGNAYRSISENDSTTYFNSSDSDLDYTIRYTAISFYGCRDTAFGNITVRPQPRAFFSIPAASLCAPAIIYLKDSSINAYSYEWGTDNDFTRGNSYDTLILPGTKLFDTTYLVSHRISSVYGCLSYPVYKSLRVFGRPESDFNISHDSACMRELIRFSNNSLGSVRYLWNFGDNSFSNLVNPKHSFYVPAQAGDSSFTVSLEASSSNGCKDTSYRNIYTVNVPKDTIIADKQAGCTDLTVLLVQKSNLFGTLNWDFGDNSNPEYGDSVWHTYYNYFGNNPVRNTVSLYRKRFNCIDTARQEITVYPSPTAGFKVQRNDPCDGGIYQMVNQSLYHSSSAWFIDSQYYFNGNSFSALLPGLPHKDTIYRVELIAGNQWGCYDTISQTVKAKRKQVVAFTNDSFKSCENIPVHFDNKSQNAVRYFWKFGDGNASNDVNPDYTFNRFGKFKVILYGFDKDGCIDSSDGKTEITVTERPGADFTYLPLNPKLPDAKVDFKAKPSILSVNEDDLTYDWDFGDNTYPAPNSSEKNPVHIYNAAGPKPVTLRISNLYCMASITKMLNIEAPTPVAEFIADSTEGCVPLKVHFKNLSIYADSYRWIFGDGSPDSYEKDPVHTYEYAGNWDVTLIASGNGGSGSITKKFLITTYPVPMVDFYTNKNFMTLPNAVFNMVNLSNSITNYWEVTDSNNAILHSSLQRDPSFTINNVGRFNVRLIGVNSFGCRDTMYKPDYISTQGPGYVYIPNAFSPNNNGKNEGFMPSLYNVKDRNYAFRVFNRWGEMVYETNDIHAFWDGNFKGTACEQDVYIWTVNGEFYNGDLFTFKGTVTVLR